MRSIALGGKISESLVRKRTASREAGGAAPPARGGGGSARAWSGRGRPRVGRAPRPRGGSGRGRAAPAGGPPGRSRSGRIPRGASVLEEGPFPGSRWPLLQDLLALPRPRHQLGERV